MAKLDINKIIANPGALDKIIKSLDEVEKKILKVGEKLEREGGMIKPSETRRVLDHTKAIHNLVNELGVVQKALKEVITTRKKADDAQKKTIKHTIEEKEHLRQLRNAERLDAKARLAQVGTIEALRAKLAIVSLKWAQLTQATGANSAATRKLTREKKHLTAVLKQVESQTGDNRRNIGKYSNAFGRLRNSIISVSQAAGVFFGIMGAVRLFKNMIGIIRDFEKTNATLAGVLQVEKEEMEDLSAESIRLSKITIKTADEIANLELSYARLGFVQHEIIALTEDTITGSIALNAALAETALLTGAMVKTFDEFDVTDAAEILDVMSLATAKSALNFEKLQKALPIVGGAANAAGLSFTRTTALLGKLADSGIDVSTSATAIRNILIRSAKAGMSYNEMLNLVANSSDKLSAAADHMGVRAAVSGSILAANLDGIRDLDLMLVQAQGTMREMADKELNTLDGAIQLVNSAWEGYILDADRAKNFTTRLRTSLQFLAKNLSSIIDNLFKAGKAWVLYYGAQKIAIFYQRVMVAETARLAIAATASADAALLNAASTGAQASANVGLVNAQGAAIASTAVQTTGTTLLSSAITFATGAWTRFMAVLKANVFGLIAAAIYLVWSALSDLNHEMDVHEEKNFFSEQAQRNIDAYATPRIKKLTELTIAIKDSGKATEERRKALEEFNSLYVTTISQAEGEEEMLIQLAEAYRDLTKEIDNRATRDALIQEIVAVGFQVDILARKIQNPDLNIWGNIDEEGKKQDIIDHARKLADLEKLKAKLLEIEFILGGGNRRADDSGGGSPTPIAKGTFDDDAIEEELDMADKKFDKLFKMEWDARLKTQKLKAVTLQDELDYLKARYEFELFYTKAGIDGRQLLFDEWADKSDKAWQKWDKKRAREEEKSRLKQEKADAEALQRKQDDFDRSMKYILDGVQQLADMRVQRSQWAVDKQMQQVELQNQRAVAGLSNTLAEQQVLLAKAEQEREAALKRQQRMAKARALYDAYSGYVQSDPNTAVMNTLKDFAILEAITAVFEKGGIIDEHPDVKSGILKGDSHKAKSGGIKILAQGNEGILSTKAMGNLGKDNFHAIMDLAESGRVDDQLFSKQLQQHTTVIMEPGLKTEMVKTRRAIEAKKELSAPELIDGIISIVETSRKSGRITRNCHKRKMPRF